MFRPVLDGAERAVEVGVFKVTMYEFGTTPSEQQWFFRGLGLELDGLEPMPAVLAAPTLAIRIER